MEVEAASILFERSLSVNGLRYTTVVCDGDSQSYHATQQAKVYGFIPVEEEDCVNHMQKRAGIKLHSVQKDKPSDGGRTSGKGRLTGDPITKPLTN